MTSEPPDTTPDNVVDIRDYERPVKRNFDVIAKCLHADDYKAIFPPHCRGGNSQKPCRACTEKWDEAQAARRSNAISNS